MQTTKPLTQAKPSPEPRRRRGLLVATAALVVAIIAVGVVITVAGGDNEPDVAGGPVAAEDGPISSFDDIVGTYFRRGPGAPTFLLFQEDGTVHNSPDKNQIVDNPVTIHQTTFEGTRLFMTTTGTMCDQPDPGGSYEVQVLESGSLQFVAVNEDTCALRSAVLQGFGNNDVEFEPVP